MSYAFLCGLNVKQDPRLEPDEIGIQQPDGSIKAFKFNLEPKLIRSRDIVTEPKISFSSESKPTTALLITRRVTPGDLVDNPPNYKSPVRLVYGLAEQPCANMSVWVSVDAGVVGATTNDQGWLHLDDGIARQMTSLRIGAQEISFPSSPYDGNQIVINVGPTKPEMPRYESS